MCIHSVVIAEKFRKNGYGTQTVKEYVKHVKKTEKGLKRIALLAKKNLIKFYENCGFTLQGKESFGVLVM